MVENILEELLGQRVEVWTVETGIKDAGILEAYDDQWIKVRQSHGTMLYFCIVNVRLIKPV